MVQLARFLRSTGIGLAIALSACATTSPAQRQLAPYCSEQGALGVGFGDVDAADQYSHLHNALNTTSETPEFPFVEAVRTMQTGSSTP